MTDTPVTSSEAFGAHRATRRRPVDIEHRRLIERRSRIGEGLIGLSMLAALLAAPVRAQDPCDVSLSSWRVAGPVPADSTHPDTLEFPAVTNVKWTPWAEDKDSFLVMRDVVPIHDFGGTAMYAQSYVAAPETRRVALIIRSQELVTLWVNGVLRYQSPRIKRRDTIGVTLRPGINRLTYRLIARGRDAVLFARFSARTSPDPVGDLRAFADSSDAVRAPSLTAGEVVVGPIWVAAHAQIVGATLTVPVTACVARRGRATAETLQISAGRDTVATASGASPVSTTAIADWAALARRVLGRTGSAGALTVAIRGRTVAAAPIPLDAQALLTQLSRVIDVDTASHIPADIGRGVLAGLTVDPLPHRSAVRVREPGWPEIADGVRWGRVITGDSSLTGPRDTVARALLAAALNSDKRAYNMLVAEWLTRLAPAIAQARQDSIALIGQSHIDAAWLWRARETQQVVDATWTTATKLMGEFPDMHFAGSSAQYYVWLEQRHPETLAKIQELERAGRWHAVGGWWVEPDLNMPSGESLVRQGLYGQRTFIRLFGHTSSIAWTPDSFGFPWSMPQIFAKSAMTTFLTHKVRWNDTHRWPKRVDAFWWEGPDGTRLFTYIDPDNTSELSPSLLVSDEQLARDSGATSRVLALYGVGDHGGGPTREMLDDKIDLERVPTFPVMRDAKPDSVFAAMRADLGAARTPPVVRDELYLEYHRGVFTTHADVKRWNRRMENRLAAAEAAAAISTVPYPLDTLRAAWERVLFNQFHDVLAGSAIDSVYQDVMAGYRHADSLTTDVLDRSVQSLAARLDTRGPGLTYAVFNPSGTARTDVVRLPAPGGGEDTLVVTVPATGIRVVHAIAHRPYTKRGSAPVIHETSVVRSAVARTIESDALRVEIDSITGAIASLYDKRAHRAVLQHGANTLLLLADHPRDDDAWNIDNLTGTRTPIDRGVTVDMPASVGGAQMIEVRRHADRVDITQRYILRQHVPRLDIETVVDWHTAHQLLKAVMPLAFHIDSSRAEIPYAVIARPTTPVSTYDSARFEVPMQRFVDVDAGDGSYGVAFVNNSKYGYSADGDTLFLSLLRAPKTPDSTADMGIHQFTYSIVPHAGGWRAPVLRETATALNAPLVVVPVSAHAGAGAICPSTVTIAGLGVELSALKRAEDGNGTIIRLVETTGRPTDATIMLGGALKGATTVIDTDLLERAPGLERSIVRSALAVHLSPWEIRTLVVH